MNYKLVFTENKHFNKLLRHSHLCKNVCVEIYVRQIFDCKFL